MFENNEEMRNRAKRESGEPYVEPPPPVEDKVRLYVETLKCDLKKRLIERNLMWCEICLFQTTEWIAVSSYFIYICGRLVWMERFATFECINDLIFFCRSNLGSLDIKRGIMPRNLVHQLQRKLTKSGRMWSVSSVLMRIKICMFKSWKEWIMLWQ